MNVTGPRYPVLQVLAALVLLFGVSGCAALSRLGDREKFERALGNALKSKAVLLPAAAAGVFSIAELDERTSRWAADHTPLFASEKTARDFSDVGLYVLQAETAATAFIAPPIAQDAKWHSQFERPAVEFLAWGSVVGTTDLLKSAVGRTRPDGSNDKSFPSGHTSQSFALATLSNRNLDYIEQAPGPISLSDDAKTCFQFGNYALASAVGWARIEGRKHYPSDVLAGAAVGNFLSIFIHDWLIGEAGRDEVTFFVVPTDGGAVAQLAFPF